MGINGRQQIRMMRSGTSLSVRILTLRSTSSIIATRNTVLHRDRYYATLITGHDDLKKRVLQQEDYAARQQSKLDVSMDHSKLATMLTYSLLRSFKLPSTQSHQSTHWKHLYG